MFGNRDIGKCVLIAALGILSAAPASLGSVYPLNESAGPEPERIFQKLKTIFGLYLGGALAWVAATFISIGITALFTI